MDGLQVQGLEADGGIVVLGRRAAHHDVQVALGQLRQQMVGGALDQLHARLGHALQQLHHRQRHRVRSRRARRADHHPAAPAFAQRRHVRAGAVQLRLDALGMGDQHIAVRRRPQAARVALEQRQPDVVFQILQPLGQARLRGVEHRRRVADVAGLGQAEQHFQIAQAQSMSPVHTALIFLVCIFLLIWIIR
ncbi:hypothetical protein FQZ97_738420 [compost metagenome]